MNVIALNQLPVWQAKLDRRFIPVTPCTYKNMNSSINNPNQAIALAGEQTASPLITAKGVDELAQWIFAVAKEHDVPIREEPELVIQLSEVPLGDEIPEILYIAVSEVLSFAYMLK